MKKLKFLLATLFIVLVHFQINGQCAEIYFYRLNTMLQSDKMVYLYQDGVEIARVKKGDRYKAEVCANSQFIFSVKLKPTDTGLSKVNVQVENGKKYYLKIACPFTPEIATINQKSDSKGKKDLRKGNKFTGSEQRLNLKSNGTPMVQNSTSPSTTQTRDETFQRTHILNDFKFEIVDIVKAGGLLVLKYKITNMAPDDRYLTLSQPSVYFYDDLGNLIFAKQVCISNSCNREAPFWPTSPPQTINLYWQGKLATNVMPSGIPLNGSITIDGVNGRAEKFVKGVVWWKSEHPFKIEYHNFIFPEVVDAQNPLKRNFGENSIELKSAKRKGNGVVLHYTYTNGSDKSNFLDVNGATVFDDKGNQYNIQGLAFIKEENRINPHYQNSKWVKEVNANSQIDFYLFVDNVDAHAMRLPRINVNFKSFNLTWKNDVTIQGSSSSTLNHSPSKPKLKLTSNYINYNDFENKVRKNESVIGKKIILKKIYFNSGSDEILNNSYSQLDQLASLMLSNANLKVEISGHTDNVGERVQNMVLSQKRADAIKYYLMSKSIMPARISSVGKGELEPIYENNSAAEKQKNRRVEILIIE